MKAEVKLFSSPWTNISPQMKWCDGKCTGLGIFSGKLGNLT